MSGSHGIFLPLLMEKTRDENAPLSHPSASIQFGIKSVHDVIEGTKCMARHTASEKK